MGDFDLMLDDFGGRKGFGSLSHMPKKTDTTGWWPGSGHLRTLGSLL